MKKSTFAELLKSSSTLIRSVDFQTGVQFRDLTIASQHSYQNNLTNDPLHPNHKKKRFYSARERETRPLEWEWRQAGHSTALPAWHRVDGCTQPAVSQSIAGQTRRNINEQRQKRHDRGGSENIRENEGNGRRRRTRISVVLLSIMLPHLLLSRYCAVDSLLLDAGRDAERDLRRSVIPVHGVVGFRCPRRKGCPISNYITKKNQKITHRVFLLNIWVEVVQSVLFIAASLSKMGKKWRHLKSNCDV